MRVGKKRAIPSKRKRSQRGKNGVRGLVDAIFEQNDPVTTATNLLKGKADSTVAKIWALLLEYRYGKPVQHLEAQGADGAPVIVQLVTTVPRPLREYESGSVIETEDL